MITEKSWLPAMYVDPPALPSSFDTVSDEKAVNQGKSQTEGTTGVFYDRTSVINEKLGVYVSFGAGAEECCLLNFEINCQHHHLGSEGWKPLPKVSSPAPIQDTENKCDYSAVMKEGRVKEHHHQNFTEQRSPRTKVVWT